MSVAGAAEPNGPTPRPAPETARGRAMSLRARPAIAAFVICLAVVYVLKQVLFTFAFQPFSGHDEVAHYSYIEVLTTEGRVPRLPDLESWQAEAATRGDTSFDQLPTKLYPYCMYAVVGWHCEPYDRQWTANPPRMVTYLGDLYPTGYQYTANHPPLYYVLTAPVYLLAEDWTLEAQHYALRLAAIPFGLITVLLAFLMTRQLFPNDNFLLVTVPAFVAFQPQISYEAAMINNDIAAIAAFSWLLCLIIRGIRHRFPVSTCVWIGVALGIAVLAKSTSLTGAPIIAVAIILTMGWRNLRDWVGRGLLVLIPAVVIVAPWYFSMWRTYGNFDALPQIQALQFWNNSAGSFMELLTDREFLIMRFRETWGEFGWRLMPLDTNLLWAIAIPVIVALVGLVWYVVSEIRQYRSSGDGVGEATGGGSSRAEWIGVATLALACVIAYLAVIQFGTQFELTQARYFFPVVNAAALLTMLGLRTIIPVSVHRYAQGVIFGALLVLNIVILVQYVFPQFVSV